MLALIPAFLLVALLYASAGLAGGSAYLPLLVLGEVDVRLLPAIALICNMVVVSGSLANFARLGHFNWRFAAPLALCSMPFAWAGGQINIDRETFRLVLGIVLICAAVALFYTSVPSNNRHEADGDGFGDRDCKGQRIGRWIGLPIGSALGFLSGLTGIGGGVFLAPILLAVRSASPQVIAATCSLFIFVNSAAGFASHGLRLREMGLLGNLYKFYPLFIAVLIGGLMGNFLNIAKLPTIWIRRITAIILVVAGARLLYDWFLL